MASIQDTVNAAYRIKESAKGVQQRTATSAEMLTKHNARLTPLVRGSRSGEEAVQRISEAQREVRDSAARLLSLQTDIDRFIQDLTK